MNRFPFPIPMGWFALRYSDELAPGQVEALHYFGRDLVLFRTEAGVPVVFDAFCPHLGAHLGHGGVVAGERLRCPFHGWAFTASGQCADIPYASRVPRPASTVAWEVVEQNGRIWIWHGTSGESPFYAAPRIPELDGNTWRDHRRYFWSLRTCLQEMSENGADSAHFRFVHDMKAVPEMNLRIDGARTTSSTATRFPGPGHPVEGMIDVESFGMGCDVIRYSGACDVLEIVCGIPIDSDHVEVRMAYSLKEDGGADRLAVSQGVADFVAGQFEHDVPIWENKIYRQNPMLCDGDGPIAEFRRWCQQFYPGEQTLFPGG